ncbi:PREDICTED: pectin acetylesterase 5-like [Amphimedon queenslandica]|uniref:Pectin acetylesterase n=1 Tax=Amphimedon queenslandica TaxID=400682 RepID=A0A1X7UD88_AMPQE|nr:PREDICTED: pectin acetylesterase 5-like [Amphimedon queenslandica]|eukprot:XP_011405404.1 PREDICTED: pectin acetylesterase 5-like [Amphimedon queenslandica]
MFLIAYGLALSFFLCIIECRDANLVLVENPREALCLDGSPPGYYIRKGFGSGVNKWILHLQGGGWCYDKDDCLKWSKTDLGSSKNWPQKAPYTYLNSGLLSYLKTKNPDFYEWNVVHVQYCDGASYSGYVESPVQVSGTSIYFRGIKILEAIIQSLKDGGMNSAEEVILTGCSAGGLAAFLHADRVKSLLPRSVKYRVLPDAGYFIDAPNVDGDMHIRSVYTNLFNMQNCSGGVDQDCIAAYSGSNDAWKCFMAQYTYPYISSPTFTLHSLTDTWQLENIVELDCLPPSCTATQMKEFYKFTKEFKVAAAPVISSSTNGAFLNSCLKHCQSMSSYGWNGRLVKGQTAAATFSNWYFKKEGLKNVVDCPYPCNKSC